MAKVWGLCRVQFTNVSKDFKGTLDYILYTTDSLVPVALLDLPDESLVQKHKQSGLPNEHWSSDHIALMAEFQYRQQPT
jgi:CCR4-NOT transcription complex subunit 6